MCSPCPLFASWACRLSDKLLELWLGLADEVLALGPASDKQQQWMQLTAAVHGLTM